jgi:glycine betaine/choline ABC-type transport system substrate-binding protein
MQKTLRYDNKKYWNPPKYKAMKYLGDDKNCWAVFNHEDVFGLKSPIRNPKIKPLIDKLTQPEARSYIAELLAKGE